MKRLLRAWLIKINWLKPDSPDVLSYVRFKGSISPKAHLIDIRSESDFASGHIYNATNIPFEMQSYFLGTVTRLPTKAKYLLYCNDGRQSEQAALLLAGKGFTQIGYLEQGLNEWEGNLIIEFA